MQDCWNVASLSLFCRYYFGRCSAELDELVPFPYSRGRSTRYSDRLHEFSVTIPRCYKDVYVNSFFPSTGRFWNSLPIECFPLNYDLNGFKSRINRFPVFFKLLCVLFFPCDSMPRSCCSALHYNDKYIKINNKYRV